MDRLFVKGLITTILGFGVLTFCGFAIYNGKSTASELSGWFAFALTLLRANDSLIGIKKEE